MAELFDSLAGAVAELVEVLGLPGITLIALLENLFPPTPSEFLYPLAGKLAFDGELTLWGVIIAGVIGSLAGSLIYYALGYWLGAERARRAIRRFGTLKLARFSLQIVAVEDYDRALLLFQRRGGVIVLAARVMPLVHSVVSIPAGVTRMGLLPFLFFTTLGSILWIAPLTLLGFWLGSEWERILNWMEVYENFWYLVIILVVAYLILKRIRARHAPEVESYTH